MKNSKFDKLFNTIMEDVSQNNVQLKELEAKRDELMKEAENIPNKLQAMSEEEIEQAKQKIIAALEKQPYDWKKGEEGKWEYQGNGSPEEGISELLQIEMGDIVSSFELYWSTVEDIARLKWTEEYGNEDDFDFDPTGGVYDEWVTDFYDYVAVGWLGDFLNSIIDWD